MAIFDNEKIIVYCQECSKEFTETIRWFKRHSVFTCSCGAANNINKTKLNKTIRDIEKRFDKMVGKRR